MKSFSFISVFWFGLLFVLVFLLEGCRYCPLDYNDCSISKDERDSLLYLWEHHITFNSNFEVTVDSIILQERFLSKDFAVLHREDRIVVADFMILPHDSIDSIWVKVAHDQLTMGWIRRTDLLSQVVPIDPVSKIIHAFSANSNRLAAVTGWVFLLLLVVGWIGRHRLKRIFDNKVDSLYPLLLCLLSSSMAMAYTGVQTYVPKDWTHFYYNPSLNPLLLPMGISLFVCLFWGMVVVSVAVIEEVFRKLPFLGVCYYVLFLIVLCLACYQLFVSFPSFYFGLFCLVLLWGYFFFCCVRRRSKIYRCGYCGNIISQKGKCPHCGVVNE